MVHPMRAVLFALLSLSSLAAAAQEPPAALCRAYDNGSWKALGRGSLESCLKAVDKAVPGFNHQGFKFGLAGRQLLAADTNYFYRSEDAGRSWSAFGYRAAVKSILDAAAPLQPATLPVAAAEVLPPASGVPQTEERSCSVYGDGAWKAVGSLPLPACGDALAKTPDVYDDTGYKYGYWGKLYLAADVKNILTSDNGQDWTPLRPR